MDLRGLFGRIKKKAEELVNAPINYFNPTSNGGQNFWSSPIAQGMAKAQQFIESPKPINIIPYQQSSRQDTVPQKIAKFATNIPIGMVNSIVGQGMIKPLTDVGQIIGRPFSGRNYDYNQMGAVGRTGLQIGGLVNPSTIQQNKTKYGIKQVAGNLAEIAEPIMNAYVPGKGVQIAKKAIVRPALYKIARAAKEGAKIGGGFGLAQGLSENRNEKNNAKYIGKVALSTGIGAVGGAVMSGALAGGGTLYGKTRDLIAGKYKRDFPKVSPEEAHRFADGLLRDEFGKFKKEALALPENKLKPFYVGEENKTPAQIKIIREESKKIRKELGLPDEFSRPGLGIREITSSERATLRNKLQSQQPQQGTIRIVGKQQSKPIVDQSPLDGLLSQIDERIGSKNQVISTKQRQLQPGGQLSGTALNKIVPKQVDAYKREGFNAKGEPINFSGDGYTYTRLNMEELAKLKAYNATPNSKALKNIKIRDEKALAQNAKDGFNEWMGEYRKNTLPATPNNQAAGVANLIKSATKSPAARNTEELKDINGFNAGFRDIYRNFKEVYGKRLGEVKRVVLDPFDKSKGDFIDMQKRLIEELDTKIVKGLGIQKGSKESELVQMYGEKKINLQELQQKTKDWQKIVDADSWFRNKYDSLLNEVNATRKQIYPNDPTKIIPKRSDYYRHFRELSQGVQGLLNIFDTPAGISSNLSGISEFTKPKSKFLSLAQRRLGGTSENDAVGGFIDYAKSAAYAKHIDPNTARFRALSEELANETAAGTPNAGKLNNFVEYLQDVANDLSGKTNPMDRTAQKWIPGGRKTFQVINWLNSRVKANAVIGNLSSTIAQIFNVPQGIASAGPVNSVKGLRRSLASIFTPNAPMEQSTFIKERYASTLYDRFDRGILQNTKKFAAWMTGVLDEVGTKYIWNSQYEKALSQGIQNPAKFADDLTRSLVAGRGIGEVPLAQKAKVFQLIAPFQLEVGNLWHVMGDMVSEKAFGKIATLFLANYLFNKGAEVIRGSDVTFDPIQATIEGLQAYGQEENKGMGALKLAGRLGGEVLSNWPVGQYAAAMYPEYGMTIGDTKLPTRKDLFGKGDPTRYGTGPILAKAVTEPQYRIVPPFGGAQIKKTIEGVSSFMKGASEDKKGNVRFPIEQNVSNAVKSAAFGQYGTPEARNYFDNNRRALSEKQTSVYNQSSNKNQVYNDIISKREQNSKIDTAKEQLKQSGKQSTTVGKSVLLLQPDGSVKTIDTSFQPTKPESTGNTELDKKLISKYKGEITKKANDVVALYEAGEITKDEAEKQLKSLISASNATKAPKKVKMGTGVKFTIKKISVPRIKIAQSKIKPRKITIAKSKQKKLKLVLPKRGKLY